MTCRRICRELLSFVRFGELGPRSQPHLDHLAGCASCRDEVGYDREMVQRLRVALAARVEGMDPSPTAWEQILRRAQAPDPEPVGWLGRLGAAAARRRTTTAMAGTALALVLALNMEVIPVTPAAPTDATPGATASSASSERWARPSLGRQLPASMLDVADESPRVESTQPELRMTGIVAGLVPPSAPAVEDQEESEPEVRVVFRSVQPVGPLADDDRLEVDVSASNGAADDPDPQPASSPAEPGQPS